MDLVEQFIQERQYLKNVSPATVVWYRNAFSTFAQCGLAEPQDGLLNAIKSRVIELQSPGDLKAISINSRLRVVNAYLRWLQGEGHTATVLTVPRLKEPETVIQPWSAEQVHAMVSYKPKNRPNQRVHALALLIADTGLRLSEALALTRSDVDLDSLLVTVRYGKGGKSRVVPISIVGRKILFKWMASHSHDLVFCVRSGNRWTKSNALRSFKRLCGHVGIKGVRTNLHTLRHSFAAAYIREGGDVFSLQRMLGHSTLEMTNRYVRSLGIDDLKAAHERLSLLGGAGR